MAKPKDAFKGFTPEAFEFLSILSENNNKTWFDAHRGVYDAAIVAPALLFVESMALALKAIAPSVKSDPWIGGSLLEFIGTLGSLPTSVPTRHTSVFGFAMPTRRRLRSARDHSAMSSSTQRGSASGSA